MSDHNRRALALWIGVGCVLCSDIFLYWYPKPRSKDYGDFSVDQDQITEEEEKKYKLLFKLVSCVRKVAFWFTCCSLLLNEFSYLYCGGHTVLSFLLTRIAKNLTERNLSYSASFRLLSIAVWWNKLWLSSNHILLCENYTDLAVVSGLLKNRTNFQKYSRLLAELKFKRKKVILKNRWQKFSNIFSLKE